MRTIKTFALLLTIGLSLSFGLALGQENEQEKKEPEAKQEKTLGKSWSAQAGDAYAAKDYNKAIFLYHKWLEADPRDASSWYNLACTYSLARNEKGALDALENAILAGYDDAGHMGRDTDLDFIRRKVRFRAMIEKLQDKQKSETAAFRRHHVKFESTGLYAAYLPEGYNPEEEKQPREYKLVVTLHGAGSTETGHGEAFRKVMGAEDCIYICPRAPFAIPVRGDLGYVAWIDESRNTEWGGKQSLTQYCGLIDKCVEDAMSRYHVEGKKVYVIGHSMGGGSSLCYTALYPERVAAVFCYAGYHAEAVNTAECLAKVKAAGCDVTICHCKGDAVVSFESGEKAAKAWGEAGITVKSIWVEEDSHSLIEPVREHMKDWADKTVRGKQ